MPKGSFEIPRRNQSSLQKPLLQKSDEAAIQALLSARETPALKPLPAEEPQQEQEAKGAEREQDSAASDVAQEPFPTELPPREESEFVKTQALVAVERNVTSSHIAQEEFPLEASQREDFQASIEAASEMEPDVILFGVVQEAFPMEASQQEQPGISVEASPEVRQESFPPEASQQRRDTQDPELSTDEGAIPDRATTLLKAAHTPASIQQPSRPTEDRAPVTDRATILLRAVNNSSPVIAPQQEQTLQNTESPTDRPSVADQATALLEVVKGISHTQEKRSIPSSTEQSVISDQPTSLLPAVHNSSPALLSKIEQRLPQTLRRAIGVGMARLQEPQPEGLLTRGLQVVRSDTGLALVPLLALTNALGLLLVSLSYYVSLWAYSYPIIEISFFGGLLLLFVPNLVRLLSRTPSRLERICLLCLLGLSLYFVQFMNSPLHFSSFDDFLHWRTADDILRTGHLFSENSMLPVSPYYPGLEIVTNALSTTTGLSTFYAGIIVINIAHLLMVLSIYLLYEHITRSSRMAGIATLIYMLNSHFIFFDTIYNYETLALPLALFMLYILARYAKSDQNHRWVVATAWLVLLAVTITHHMTDYFFDGLLLLWAIVSFFRPAARGTRIHLVSIAVCGVLFSLIYAFLIPGNPVWSYLSQYFGSAFTQLEQIITGAVRTRPLFASNVQAPPIWDRLFMTGSVVLVTFALPFGLLSLQRRHRHNALALTFGIIALVYPATQAFRFTTFGTEITDRATSFLFLPIAYVLTILITHFWPTRSLTKRAISLISSALIVILLGGVILATGPNLSGMPGPYLVGADGRSIEPEGIEAAVWSLTYLGPDNRIATDRVNQMLMSTYGDQRILTRLDDNLDISPLFYSSEFDNDDISLLRYGQIHYLVVDTRLSTALPLVGIYFENDRPTSIISSDALTKFNAVTQIDRLFDSGDIVIYDTGAFINGSGP